MMFFNLVFMSCGNKQNTIIITNGIIHLIKQLCTKAVLQKEGSIMFRALEILSAHAASLLLSTTIEKSTKKSVTGC